MFETPESRQKVVGRRVAPRGGLEHAADLFELVIALRGAKPFIPRGVHRFAAFEESQAWSIRMMARRTPAPPPRLSDLIGICRGLNREEARYMVIGGMAMVQAGFVRATEDIDLLVESTPDNLRRLRAALSDLPDRAVQGVADDDLDRYVVVRVDDEVVVDLLKAACGIEYPEAIRSVELVSIEGVTIPFANPDLRGELNRRCARKTGSIGSFSRLCWRNK